MVVVESSMKLLEVFGSDCETGALYLAYLHALDKYIACLDRASEALLKLTRER